MPNEFSIAMFGAGMMSRAAALAYLSERDVERIIIADHSENALNSLASALPDDQRLSFTKCDAKSPQEVERIMNEVDGAFCAIHYELNVELSKSALRTNTHMVDLGGNNDIVSAQRNLDAQAERAGVCITPDCGLAPGLASMLVAWGVKRFSELDSIEIRVGGLPLNPRPPFMYERLFSTEGLINEYKETPLVLRDHQVVEAEALADSQLVHFDEPIGTLVAFNTSGGLSTLGESFGSCVRNMDYKTLRYQGHDEAMRWVFALGLMSERELEIEGSTIVPRQLLRSVIEKHLPICERDRTIVRVVFHGSNIPGGSHVIDIIEEHDEGTNLTAMARLTAWPAATISLMQCRGEIATGVKPQEISVNPDMFLAQLTQRGIKIRGTE